MKKPNPLFLRGDIPTEGEPLRFDANNPGKVCRTCRKYKPNKGYQFPRMKTCIECFLRRVRRTERGALAVEQSALHASGAPALTSTREGMNAYNRERYRANMKPAKLPLQLPTRKLCRSCQKLKPISAFSSWRIRRCLACDGDILERNLHNPQRVR